MHLRKQTSNQGRASLLADPYDVLRDTSRTFYFSIVNLPPGICQAVMSAYLSLRAIDEIEDHARLDKVTKTRLLLEINSNCLKSGALRDDGLSSTLEKYRDELPEVTNRLAEWLALAPESVASNICDANATMARRMAYWVGKDWQIGTKDDLDAYTFSVAGAVGLLLSDLWAWHNGTLTNKDHAVGFGRGLQSVNILRNRADDLARGVDFFPDGWTDVDMRLYSEHNLSLADAYVEALLPGPVRDFCRLPLSLAYATLDALGRGEQKLSRATMLEIIEREKRSLL